MAKTKSAAPKAATKTTPVKPVEKKVETAKTPIKKDEPVKTVAAEVKPVAAKSATKETPAKEAPKATAKKVAAKKPATKKTVKKDAPKATTKKTVAVKSNVTLQINGIDFDPVQIQNDAIKAAKKIKADVKDVNVYINADESVAYFTIDSVGDSDYKINL